MSLRRHVEWSAIMDGQKLEHSRMVYGVGEVQVSPREIAHAEKCGGDPIVEIVDASSNGNITPYWVIGAMYPRDPEIVQHNLRIRLEKNLLQLFYKAHVAEPGQPQVFWGFAEPLGISKRDVETVYMALQARGLLRAYGGGGSTMITQDGIDEVERSLRYPSQMSNEMRTQMNQTNNISGGIIGNIVSGAQNTASAHQTVGIQGDELAAIIDTLRQEVSNCAPAEQATAAETIDAIEEEAQRDSPRRSIFDALVGSLPAAIAASPGLIELATKLWP